MPASEAALRDLRENRIIKALKTSIASKGISVGLQLLAVPLIASSLGIAAFGYYTLIAGLPAYASMADFGVGPALARKLADAEASGNRTDASRVFSAAAWIALFGGLLAILGIGSIGGDVIRHNISLTDEFAEQLSVSCWVVAISVGVQIFLSLGGKARSGYQEIHISNSYGMLANFLTIICITTVFFTSRSPLHYLIATTLPQVVANSANLASLILGRPYLLCEFLRPNITQLRQLLGEGLLFSLSVALFGATREIAKFGIGKAIGLNAVGVFGLVLQVITIGGGITVMITSAIWPALNDAVARKDWTWFTKSTIRVSKLLQILLPLQVLGSLLAFLFLHRLFGSSAESITIWEALAASALLGCLVVGNFTFMYSQILGTQQQFTILAAVEFGVLGLSAVCGGLSLINTLLSWLVLHAVCTGLIGLSFLRKRYAILSSGKL